MEGRYTIILLPDKETGDFVSALRSDLADLTELPSLPPHVTLREDFFSKKIDDFIEEYTREISNTPSFELSFAGIQVFQRGHVVFNVQNNDVLQKLHEKTVVISQKYVSTPRIIDYGKLNDEQKELVEKYQSPFYFKYYCPHMTIVKLKQPNDKKKILDLIGPISKFSIND
jgi:2'-5' RNA ligase